MRFLFLFMLFAFQIGKAQSFNFPKLVNQGNNLSSMIPANWKAIDTAYGDLNNDQLKDLVLVLEYREPVSERRAYGDNDTELILEFQRPRMLAVYFKNTKDAYVLALQNNNFILREKEGGALGDPLKSVNISDNKLNLSFEGGSGWRWKLGYYFKYQQKDWALVQANNTYYNVETGEMTDKAYDFTTRKIKQTNGNLYTVSDNHKISESVLHVNNLKTFNSFKKPWTWEIMKDNFL